MIYFYFICISILSTCAPMCVPDAGGRWNRAWVSRYWSVVGHCVVLGTKPMSPARAGSPPNLWGILPAPKSCASMKSFWDKGTHVNTWPLLRMSPAHTVLDGMQNLIWIRRKSSKFVTETFHFDLQDFGDLALFLPHLHLPVLTLGFFF